MDNPPLLGFPTLYAVHSCVRLGIDMGHTKPELLKDLKKELELISALEGVKQKSPGIFYLKSASFLHFHDKDGKRWADVKTPHGGWTSLEIDFGASVAEKSKFVKSARTAHAALTMKKPKSS